MALTLCSQWPWIIWHGSAVDSFIHHDWIYLHQCHSLGIYSALVQVLLELIRGQKCRSYHLAHIKFRFSEL